MAGTHGDLFREIGALVVAAHDGRGFDLRHTSEELARCYVNLGVPADTIARAIARSMAAVGVSLEILRPTQDSIFATGSLSPEFEQDSADADSDDAAALSPSVVFPSGVRLAVLS